MGTLPIPPNPQTQYLTEILGSPRNGNTTELSRKYISIIFPSRFRYASVTFPSYFRYVSIVFPLYFLHISGASRSKPTGKGGLRGLTRIAPALFHTRKKAMNGVRSFYY